MQKSIRTVIVFFVFFSIISCGKKEKKAAELPILDPPNTPITSEPAPVNDANYGDKMKPLPASGVPEGWTSWEDFNLAKPESRSQSILDGTDPAQDLLGEDPLCSIFVLASFLDEKSRPSYVLRTSFHHNNQTHGYLLVSLDPTAESVVGTGASGKDQIFFKFSAPGDFYSAERMNLKWFHINHYDTGVCEQLQMRKIP